MLNEKLIEPNIYSRFVCNIWQLFISLSESTFRLAHAGLYVFYKVQPKTNWLNLYVWHAYHQASSKLNFEAMVKALFAHLLS